MQDPLVGLTISFTAPPSHADGDAAPRGGLGSQVLPVAELDDDFTGEPQDGAQYLFVVRREAKTHPRVNRAPTNPYALEQAEQARQSIISSSVSTAATFRPGEVWRGNFVKHFIALRKVTPSSFSSRENDTDQLTWDMVWQRMILAPPLKEFPPSTNEDKIPPARDEGAWRNFVYGKLEKVSVVPPTRTSIPIPHPEAPVPPVEEPPPSNFSHEMTLEEAKATALAFLELDSPLNSHPISTSTSTSISLPSSSTFATPVVPTYHIDPHHPTPQLLLTLDHATLIALLSHFTLWLTERTEAYETLSAWEPSTIFAPPALRKKNLAAAATTPSTSASASGKGKGRIGPNPPLPSSYETSWILAILSRLTDLLEGRDTSMLRNLCRVVLNMVAVSEETREKRMVEFEGKRWRERTVQEKEVDERESGERAASWMIVAVVAGVWGQRDLWEDL